MRKTSLKRYSYISLSKHFNHLLNFHLGGPYKSTIFGLLKRRIFVVFFFTFLNMRLCWSENV